MGCICSSSFTPTREVHCCVYGAQGTFHVEDVADIVATRGGEDCFRPILRAAKVGVGPPRAGATSLDLPFVWIPLKMEGTFSPGIASPDKNAGQVVTLGLLRAWEMFDGREELLFAARVSARLNGDELKPPSVLLVTSLGLVGLLRLSSMKGCGPPVWQAHFHIYQLKEVNCPSTTESVLTFQPSQTLPGTLQGKPCGGGPSGGTLQVEAKKETFAELLPLLQFLQVVLSGENSTIKVTAVPEIANSPQPFWEQPAPPVDGGFAAIFAGCCASYGRTVRTVPRLSLGARYFSSIPLLQLDLTDLAPPDPVTATAVTKAWRGNGYFRSVALHRTPAPGEVEAYAAALAQAPIFDLDISRAALSPAQVQVIGRALGENPYKSLVGLDLSGTILAGPHGSLLAKGLESALPSPEEHSFRTLRFDKCGLCAGEEHSAELLQLISRRCSRLEVLDLSNNPLWPVKEGPMVSMAQTTLQALAAIWASSGLRELRLAETRTFLYLLLPGQGAMALQRQELVMDISFCNVGGPTGKLLKPILSQVRDLTVVASRLEGDPPGISEAVAAMMVCELRLPSRQLDVVDSPCAALQGVCSSGSSGTVSVRCGFSRQVCKQNRTSMQFTLGAAPKTIEMTHVAVDALLEATLDMASNLCTASWDPKNLSLYGDDAVKAVGVNLPVTATAGCFVPQAGTGRQYREALAKHVKGNPMVKIADELRGMLENPESSITSLKVSGSNLRGQTGAIVTVLPMGSGKIRIPISDPLGGGPVLARGLQGVALSKTLVELDVSNNYMGDVGAVTLGRALRTNRTLRTLNLDGNFITVAGWISFRGCLHGNKKLSKFTLPQSDINWQNEYWAAIISSCEQQVWSAKAKIKHTFKAAKGQRTWHVLNVKNQQVAIISAAKKQQQQARSLQQKMYEVQAAIQADVHRNAQIEAQSPQISKATKELWAEARSVVKRMGKVESKRSDVEAKAQQALWDKRNKLWKMWVEKAMKVSAKKKNIGWFMDLRNKKLEDPDAEETEKQCMMPDDAKAILAAMPEDQREDWAKEVITTKAWLNDEGTIQSKVDSRVVEVESEKVLLEALVSNPDWKPPPQEGFEDVVQALQKYGLDKPGGTQTNMLPPAQLIMGSNLPMSLPGMGEEAAMRRASQAMARADGIPNGSTGAPALSTPKAASSAQAPVAPMAAPSATALPTPMAGTTAMAKAVPAVGYPPVAKAGVPIAVSRPPAQPRVGMPVMNPGVPVGMARPAVPMAKAIPMVGQMSAMPVIAPGVPMAKAVGMPMSGMPTAVPVAGRPMVAAAPGFVQTGVPIRAGAVVSGLPGTLTPGQAQVQYDMLQLHRQRMRMQHMQRTNIGTHSAFRGNRWGARHYDNSSGDALSMALLWQLSSHNRYRSHGHYGDFHHHHHHGYVDPFAPSWSYAPPAHFNPVSTTEVNITNINIDESSFDDVDNNSFSYGAGGEEPPLPDGGRDEPRAEPCCAGPRKRGWLPPVSFRPLPHRWTNLGIPRSPQPQSCLAKDAADQMLRAEEKALSSWVGTLHKKLPYKLEQNVLGTRAAAASRSKEVCLVTQCSVDRLPRLREQCLAWAPGVVSVAVMLFKEGSNPGREDVLITLAEIARVCSQQGGLLIASLMHPLSEPLMEYDSFYPVNTLRNVALDGAPSDLAFLLDVDFIPSKGLWSALNDSPEIIEALCSPGKEPPCALVVPAYEVRQDEPGNSQGYPCELPRDFTELEACGSHASAFHVRHFPQGHRATDFQRWRAYAQNDGSTPLVYEVRYEEYFEPYAIISRSRAPQFDERFRGYGLNKCSFYRHCNALGFRFQVLAGGHHFVAAAEHTRSSSWHCVYGANAGPEGALRLGVIWRLFIRGLPGAAVLEDSFGGMENKFRKVPDLQREDVASISSMASLCRGAAALVKAHLHPHQHDPWKAYVAAC